MRFLVVYQDFSRPAHDLVDRLGVVDVTVLLVRKGEREASTEFLDALSEHPNAPTAVCQVVRGFKKSIESVADIQYETKKFRADDRQLTNWLLPPDAVEESFVTPSRAFAEAKSRAKHLLFADGALGQADGIANQRWKFVNLAAKLLARYATGEELGPLRNWKQTHGVDFAANGRVRYAYLISSKGYKVEGSTEWHLKEGDNTTRDNAARIYFDRVEVGGHVKICVFYVGPHPNDGSYSVCIDCGEE